MLVCIVVHSRPVEAGNGCLDMRRRTHGRCGLGPSDPARGTTIEEVPASATEARMTASALHVDLDAIAHNVARLRAHVGPGIAFIAALKGDAYGHGLLPVAATVLAAGVDMLAVVRVDHAIRLREAGVRTPILLYAGVAPTPAVVEAVLRHDLTVTVVDDEHLAAYAAGDGRVRAFVKVDVGLERLGSAPDVATGLARRVAAAQNLDLAGVYTHLHVPGGRIPDVRRYVARQYQRFTGVLSDLAADGIEVPLRVAVSSGSLRIADGMTLNGIDVGSLLYGLDTPGPADRDLGLRRAVTALTTRLTQVRDVRREDFPEFSPIPTGRTVRLGVIPFGAADGMLGISVGRVLVNGRTAPLLGVSLEHTRVDLTGIGARLGDEAVLIGRQGDAEIQIAEVATANHLHSPAFVPALVSAGVPRQYHGGPSAGRG
jgi:alanine racemase